MPSSEEKEQATASSYCALCFRVLTQRWTTCKPDIVSALVRMDESPYADLVCTALAHRHRPDAVVAVCDYCASFLKERTFASSGDVRRGRKHGMQLAVEHVLSGGSLPAPSRPHFLRCLAILDRPAHAFRHIRHGELRDRLDARKRLRGHDCAVRWLMEGRQRLFSDPILAKNLRRWLSHDVTQPRDRWWDQLPTACRFCMRPAAQLQVSTASFRNALAFSGEPSVERALQSIEHTIEPGLTHFCIHCRRISVIAHEYALALRHTLALTASSSSRDDYYAEVIALFHSRQGGGL
jgi:hypothetical protein